MQKPIPQEQPDLSKTCDTDADKIAAAYLDPQAFGELYDKYAPAVYRYLLSRLGSIEEARDIMSQTFLKAVEMFPHYKHKGFFSAWIFSIARSRYVDHLRRTKTPVELIHEEHVDPTPDPLTDMIAAERIAEVVKYIQASSEEEQEILRLRYVADLSFAEMAELLNKNQDAVKKNFYRLLARLQSQLEVSHGIEK